ncbi:putative acetolactate synthase [Linderina pennispora]|uniref:Acetolactate synthase n=1 Tax=Linderina pennispora TaxID=61395 RepID=A0A1Y1WG54_9FUNG|nr:putative acetolactate synthase [Linderina pennispora]ORX72124.1 putative acetolactate synthase [Linderina pennispora]
MSLASVSKTAIATRTAAVSSALARNATVAITRQQRRFKATKPAAGATASNPAKAQNWAAQPLANRAEKELDDSFVGMTGGEIFHEMMLRHNVKQVFGYPGGAILPVFDAIYNSSYFDFVLPRHEQGAGHMAEGYARVTGKPGVVLVTSGPGATNIITPLQDALSDGVPLIVFSGQVPTAAIGTDAFQEADVVGISRSCTKWNVMVKDVAELPRRINEAFEIATSGRPGPVLVDLPKDITGGILNRAIPRIRSSIPSRPIHENVRHVTPSSASRMHEQTVQRVAELCNTAKKPVIYAWPRRAFADKANIPVTTTLLGLGAFDETDPKSLHMLGMHGSVYANLAIQSADLIISLGARFDDRVTGSLRHFAPEAKKAAQEGRGGIVHFDILPKNINKTVLADLAVEGDVGENLRMLLPQIEHRDRSVWFDKINTWKAKYPFQYSPEEDPSRDLKPQSVIVELNRQLEHQKHNTIITTGVGQHQMWAAQYYRWRTPHSFVTSGGLGTMGFGVPAAIGAKVGQPDKTVINIDGDGSFSMTAMEMATSAQYGIGAKQLVLNNNFQGMVKQWQDLFYEQRYSHTPMRNPDFVKLAEAMGVRGLKVTNLNDLPAAMEEFLKEPGPVMLEAVVDATEHVYPMAPGGKALHEMVLGTGQKVEF